jgi:hypothetical protein
MFTYFTECSFPVLRHVGIVKVFFSLRNLLEMLGKPALVAHAYNPSYSGGRDQEDYGSKPA